MLSSELAMRAPAPSYRRPGPDTPPEQGDDATAPTIEPTGGPRSPVNASEMCAPAFAVALWRALAHGTEVVIGPGFAHRLQERLVSHATSCRGAAAVTQWCGDEAPNARGIASPRPSPRMGDQRLERDGGGGHHLARVQAGLARTDRLRSRLRRRDLRVDGRDPESSRRSSRSRRSACTPFTPVDRAWRSGSSLRSWSSSASAASYEAIGPTAHRSGSPTWRVTALVMFGLARLKRVTADELGSETLQAEAGMTFLDGCLSTGILTARCSTPGSAGGGPTPRPRSSSPHSRSTRVSTIGASPPPTRKKRAREQVSGRRPRVGDLDGCKTACATRTRKASSSIASV